MKDVRLECLPALETKEFTSIRDYGKYRRMNVENLNENRIDYCVLYNFTRSYG